MLRRQTSVWLITNLSGDKPAPLTDHTSPIDAFWEHMEELYPEWSSTRLDEFTHFMAKPDETIASLFQRMQTLGLC
jgi:hypothetical protein